MIYGGLGFATFPIGDAMVKTMAGEWAPTAIAELRYLIAALGLGVVLAVREGRRGFRIPRPGIQLMRGLGVGCAGPAFFAALMLMPMGEATSITLTQPVLTGLLAVLLLKEPARRETWIATILAFAGVLVILRPSFIELGWAALLPLSTALGMSLTMIGNRMSANLASPLAMQFAITAVASVVIGLFALAGHVSGIEELHIGAPSALVLAKCVFVAVVLTTGHWLVFMGTTRAGAGTVAPMTYLQLLGATAMGWIVFGDRPDLVALIGAAMIVSAGLYLWWNGRVKEAAELP
ncbi:hypothetical protein MB02_14865 [Croceicoccus estronivorus]|nr:hypothetical protein MB02_14865 [Croceicoccus estronivorus]